MAFDLKAFDAKYGTTSRVTSDVVNLQKWLPPSAPKSSPTTLSNFLPRVAGQAVRIAQDAVGGLAHGIVQDFQNTGQGALQGNFINGTQRTMNNIRQGDLDRINAAQLHITQQYKDGKIDKGRYNTLLKDLGKQYGEVSSSAAAQNAEAVAPEDYIKSSAKVAAIPFAFGKLTGTGGVLAPAERLLQAADGTMASGRLATPTVNGIVSAGLKAVPKYGLITAPTAEQIAGVPSKIMNKDYKGAAIDAATAVAIPGLISGAGTVLKKAIPVLKEAAFGKPGGPVASFFGSKAIQNVSPEVKKVLAQAEAYTLNQHDVKSGKISAASKFREYLNDTFHIKPGTTPEEFAQQFSIHAGTTLETQAAREAGTIGKNVVVTSDFKPAVKQAVASLAKGEFNPANAEATVKNLNITDPKIKNLVREALSTAGSKEEAIANLEGIITKNLLPEGAALKAGIHLKPGQALTYGPNATKIAHLPSLGEAGDLAIGKAPNKALGAVTGVLRKAGLGLEDANPEQYSMVRKNFTEAVGKNLPTADGKSLFGEIEKLAESKHLMDPRQLTVAEIQQGLRTSNTAEAKAIRASLDSAFTQIPLSVRGVAGKVTDLNTKYNPAARYYARAQGAGRYTKNPFFKIQQIIEPTVIGQGLTGGHFHTASEIDKGVKELVDSGFFKSAGSFSGNSGKEIGDTLLNSAGKVSGELMRSEERRLASTAMALAKQEGKSLTAFVSEKKNAELLKSIVQYSSNGFHSSNFAKALNLAVFPANYNLKVTGLAIKALAKQPPAVQFAAVKGLSNFNDFIKSDEGTKWASDNSEVLGLLNYFTPINSITSIAKALSGKGELRDLGSIGGLPFGVISQITQDLGIDKKPTAYLDPKTGEVVPSKIPTDIKSQLSVALADILGSMFTYPGKTAGMTSKKKITTGAAEMIAGKGSFKNGESAPLTAEQKHTQEVLAKYRPSNTLKVPSSTKLPPATIKRSTPVKLSSLPIKVTNKVPRAKVRAKRIGQSF